MLSQEWLLLFLIVGTAAALGPAPHQTNEESLRSALDAINRKQRSLDPNSQDYYNDLRSFKYHGGEAERKFDRDRQGEREMDEEDEEIEFLPNESGQRETVGNGFQDLNNKLLERALMDYVESIPEQEEPVTSLFRERERSSSRKRGNGAERLNVDSKELAKLFLEELQDGSPYSLGEDEEGYLDARQSLYDRYRDRGNKLYENVGPMSWGELLNKESLIRGQGRETDENDFGDREQDPNLLYLPLAERRNVNGRYPIGRDLVTYRRMAKRYPVAKRSPKPIPPNKQVTDPKVAQDLGALFGTQSTDGINHTHDHGRDHDHSHDHDHDHDHDHNHDHDHDHDHDHKHESSSEAPKVSPPPKGQKENATKLGKSKSIEVRKKSVDWSQYFGIDRRRKKASFMGGQGTQNQDDEWMLQRYYENMVENLKANNDRNYDRENPERKDRLEQMDSRLKSMKDVEEAPRYADAEDGVYLQKLKDKVNALMAVAYPLAKMRKALNDLKSNVAVQMEVQKEGRGDNNQTSSFRENGGAGEPGDKRNSNNIDDGEDMEGTCPELDAVEKVCRTVDILMGGSHLHFPCVMLQTCKACGLEQECLMKYVAMAVNICNDADARKGLVTREVCTIRALMLMQLELPPIAMQCRLNGNDSCLMRFHSRKWLSSPRYPLIMGRSNNGYDTDPRQ